jgi:hypothetical protein
MPKTGLLEWNRKWDMATRRTGQRASGARGHCKRASIQRPHVAAARILHVHTRHQVYVLADIRANHEACINRHRMTRHSQPTHRRRKIAHSRGRPCTHPVGDDVRNTRFARLALTCTTHAAGKVHGSWWRCMHAQQQGCWTTAGAKGHGTRSADARLTLLVRCIDIPLGRSGTFYIRRPYSVVCPRSACSACAVTHAAASNRTADETAWITCNP